MKLILKYTRFEFSPNKLIVIFSKTRIKKFEKKQLITITTLKLEHCTFNATLLNIRKL